MRIQLPGILEHRDIFPTRGVERSKKEKKKKEEASGTPFRPVKILRWPRCFVYWSLFTRKSFMVLSHFAACRSGTTRVSLESAGLRAAFTNRRSFSSLKKVLKLRPFQWPKFSYRHSTARSVFSPADNSKLLLKPLVDGQANRFCPLS